MVVSKRATLTLCGVGPEGKPLEIKYCDAQQGLINFFKLYGLEYNLDTSLNLQNIFETMEVLGVGGVTVWRFKQGRFLKQRSMFENNENGFMHPVFLNYKKKIFMVKQVEIILKCEFCGSYYKKSHTCSFRRREFFFHHVNSYSSAWWEEIGFFPIGSCPLTERLFITYDVETYTWHGRNGKQLVPFLLVFSVSGTSESLVKTAISLALKERWNVWENKNSIFYEVDPGKSKIGNKFKRYRDLLQKTLTNEMAADFLRENGLENSDQETLNYDELCKMKLIGRPKFKEVYIVGHNISGFDEIVLAAQVIQNRCDVSKIFKIHRNFMPRNGRILFNDITFALPNPKFKKRKDFALWENGSCDETDFREQFIKFMVRDTFALTHSSLKNAATAYNLTVQKGCCPYGAVNEFFMLGTYQSDEDGFPVKRYWKDHQEYQYNKDLFKQKQKTYDIVKQTLDYCALDVEVTEQLVTRLFQSYETFIRETVGFGACHFNVFQRPTISSNSHAIFRQILYSEVKPEKPNLDTFLMAPSLQMYDFVRQSIRGGRCYPTYLGILKERVYVYDICGMYASALTHPFPAGPPLNPYERNLRIKQWQERLNDPSHISYFNTELLPGIVAIDANPPREENLDPLPPFCSRKGGRLAWTNESLRGEICTTIDIITLHNRGWTVSIVPNEHNTIFPRWSCLAKKYVEINIKAKEKADREKNQTMRSIAKLLSNALYGSFATKLDNKKTVFADQMHDLAEELAKGTVSVKSASFIETDNFCAEIMPAFTVQYSPLQETNESVAPESSHEMVTSEDEDSLYTVLNHAHEVKVQYKPITFLEVDDDDMCLYTVEKNTHLIENNRYPSQIASFVLAWTRAFVSEWATFLYAEDYGIPMKDRKLKSVYGDTDSLFLTEEGRKLMETNGKKRIKKNGGKLVFDPDNPDLTWLVECETTCRVCGGDAYSEESVFLAPKLYALKNTVCTVCSHVDKGKLRAKGHATATLTYETLAACFLSDAMGNSKKFNTSRLTLKRCVTSNQTSSAPFTVTESTLTRVLRPWKDMTLARMDNNRLIPYSNSNPNPRNNEQCWMELPWNI